MSIDGRLNRQDSSVGAARPAGRSLHAAPLELGRSGNGDAIDMPRLWRSAADFRYTPLHWTHPLQTRIETPFPSIQTPLGWIKTPFLSI